MKTQIYNGAVDTQSSEQKLKNYKFSEFVTAPQIVKWEERDYRRLPTIRDQDGSGQCVCMTYATEMGIIFQQKYGVWMDFSSSFPYQMRKYPTISGCTSEDIFDIFPKIGNVFEKDMPSQKMNDSQSMAVKREVWFDDLAKIYKLKRIALPLDFETVASTIQATGKGVMVWFKFSTSEWTDTPTLTDKPITSGHSVTAVDYILKKGKKYLVIQDSWGLDYAVKGYRFISEEYFNARCFNAGYLLNFDFESPVLKPRFDGSVVSLQDCLKYEGLFPSNVNSTGVFGSITKKALIDFQVKYNISPAYGNFGPITKKKLTELYS
jgi:hypothetical protein